MKIDNIQKTKVRVRILLFLIVIMFLLIVLGNLFQIHKRYGWSGLILLFGSYCFVLILFWRLISIRYFDYEHSGEVISIKYYHPWKKGRIIPAIELPKQKLDSYDIQTKKGLRKLHLIVNGSNGKLSFKYNLWNISQQQIKTISESLKAS